MTKATLCCSALGMCYLEEQGGTMQPQEDKPDARPTVLSAFFLVFPL